MKRIRNAAVLLIAMGVLTACGGGGGHSSAPTASATNYTSFVKGLFANTSDTASPVSVNNRDFSFSDKNNPGAYSSVVQ